MTVFTFVFVALTKIPALRLCYNINSSVSASDHKLSSLVLGLSQLLLSAGADTMGGWEGLRMFSE